MASIRKNEELVRLLDHCRAVWMFSDIPGARVEEMADELETHLRQRLEDGGSLAEVIGPDGDAFAREWAGEETVQPSRAHRLLRSTGPPTLAVAVYLAASHALAVVTGDGNLHLPDGALGMMAFLVAASIALSRPRVLRWLLAEGRTRRAFGAGALAWLALLGTAAVSAGIARTSGEAEPLMVPWPLTAALLVLGGAMMLFTHRTRPKREV